MEEVRTCPDDRDIERIEQSRIRATAHYTPSKERAKWVKLAGQLVWYKDQIIRGMSWNDVEDELTRLRNDVDDWKAAQQKEMEMLRAKPVIRDWKKPEPERETQQKNPRNPDITSF